MHYPPISFTTLLMEFAFIAVVGFVGDPALSGSALGEMSFHSPLSFVVSAIIPSPINCAQVV